jgi:hypothetical protein
MKTALIFFLASYAICLDQRLKMKFRSGRSVPIRAYPNSLFKSVESYAQRYKNHFESEGLDRATLRGTGAIFYGDLYGMHFKAEAKDDRGKHYMVEIQ